MAKQDKGEGKEILRYAFPAFPVSPDGDPSVSLAPRAWQATASLFHGVSPPGFFFTRAWFGDGRAEGES